MTLASLIGFGLVIIGVSVFSSLLLSGTLMMTKKRLRALGPWAERRAATFALLLPPLLGLGVTAILGINSALELLAGTDHCLDHPHHLHLCWQHGTLWAAEPFAIAFVGFFSTFAFARIVQILTAHASAWRAANRLSKSGIAIAGVDRAYLVPSHERFAFTIGIFAPTIIVSRAAWEILDGSEREALISHEQAHIAHGDIWKRTALRILSSLGAPILAGKTVALFELASERLCDRNASQLVGKSSIVAGAILALARSSSLHTAPAVAAHAAVCEVTDRIHSLFDFGPDGRRDARRLDMTFLAAAAVVAAVCLLYAEALHHIFETILG